MSAPVRGWAGARRVAADYFWGPLLGASLFGILCLGQSLVWPEARDAFMMLAGFYVLGMTLALSLGFPTPARSVGGNIGRGLATTVVGAIECYLMGLLYFAIYLIPSITKDRQTMLLLGVFSTALVVSLLRTLRARARVNQPEAGRSLSHDDAPEAAGGAELRSPFPGPQPYRAADRARFFGRDAAMKKLANQILARPATTLFGPSGAGKSSLMQAGVIPTLEDSDGLRLVRVDAWPDDKAPLAWLVDAIFGGLCLGARSEDRIPLEALAEAIDLAERRSDRPILIYLDQIEQLFVAEHTEDEMKALLQGLDGLTQARHHDVHLVLSLREDYLGRLRDWTRERAELSAHGFRVGPLSVGEMVKAMCRTAVEGEPPQRWDEEEIRGLMLDVRVPGQRRTDAAEVQTAFGQIVCRALWEDRAAGKASGARRADAEAILQRYLDATVEGLGGLQEGATRLLEEHLIDDEGHRKLLTEKEARQVLGGQDAAEVLSRLERAAVLHAEEHQGSRYFELGHDWLAKKVFERKLARAQSLAKARTARRRRQAATAIALVVAGIFGGVGVWQVLGRGNQLAEPRTSWEQGDEFDALRRLGSVSPGRAPGWFQLATDILAQPHVQVQDDVDPGVLRMHLPTRGRLIVVLRGHTAGVNSAAWSPDGTRIVTTSGDRTARLWNADGTGDPTVLRGHEAPVSSAAWSPDGRRIVTTSGNRTRIWSADGSGEPVVIRHRPWVSSAAWSPDGERIVTVSGGKAGDRTARVWNADGTATGILLDGHEEGINSAAWSPDGKHIVTASSDHTARIWNADGTGKPILLEGHDDDVNSAAWSPDGTRIVTASDDKTARIWNADGTGKPIVLEPQKDAVHAAAWSPDGKRVVLASGGIAQIFDADGAGHHLIVQGHESRVNSAAWSPDGKRIVTASDDGTALVGPAGGLQQAIEQALLGPGRRR